VATGPWLASAAGATTAVLHLAAELLAEPDADLAADRLIGKITFDLQNNLGYDLFRDMDALGAVMQLASPQRAAEILLRLMELVRGTRNSALLQGAARVTAVARWDALPDAAVDAWLEYVSQAIAPPTDAQLLAITTAGALARVRPAQVAEVARRAFASTPGLAVGALLVSLTSTSSTIDVAGVATVAREAIRALRAEAAAGKFGFGAVVDAPLLLASLLVEGRQQKGWSELISFLTDPRVAWHHKLRAYSYLADHVEAIPVTMRSRLAAATLPAADDARNLFVTGSQVVGAQLRMAVALGSRDDEYVLSGLLGMAVSERPGDRIEACRSLQFVLGRRQSDALITLALALSQDSHPEVRAAGGSALAASAVLGKGRLAPLALERVKTLLIEPGVAAPRAVLDGLISAKSRQEIEIDELRPILARLALHHPSAAVRFRAQGLLNPAISGAATPPVS